jgi:MFS family permease
VCDRRTFFVVTIVVLCLARRDSLLTGRRDLEDLCGLALTPGQLIAARAVHGVGGALLVPGSLAIIGASFSEENRGKAIGA